MEIITFQITPYSNESLDYINSLSNNEIYLSFSNHDLTSDILTAALYFITKIEPTNIYDRDSSIFNDNLNNLELYPNVFVLIENGKYIGHTYVWITNKENHGMIRKGLSIDKVVNIIGMRVTKTKSLNINIVSTFLNGIKEWSQEAYYIRYIQPDSKLIKLLKQYGFYLIKNLNNQGISTWLFSNSSIGNTSLADEFIFREYDYITTI